MEELNNKNTTPDDEVEPIIQEHFVIICDDEVIVNKRG